MPAASVTHCACVCGVDKPSRRRVCVCVVILVAKYIIKKKCVAPCCYYWVVFRCVSCLSSTIYEFYLLHASGEQYMWVDEHTNVYVVGLLKSNRNCAVDKVGI